MAGIIVWDEELTGRIARLELELAAILSSQAARVSKAGARGTVQN